MFIHKSLAGSGILQIAAAALLFTYHSLITPLRVCRRNDTRYKHTMLAAWLYQ